MSQITGKYLIIIGLIIVGLGIVVYFLSGKLQWLGKLPGDIRIERAHFKFYFPLTTMILLSGLLNLIIVLVRRFLG